MIRAAVILALLTAAAVPRYLAAGFTHIVPYGADHMLFILALFFLTRELAPLLVQLTLFTLGHSLTLGLSLHGIISAPEKLVETAIALSIAFVAAENLLREKLSRWRPAIVFTAGLIHGLGFAHSIGGELATGDGFLPALLSFNLGIELGQLAVIAAAYACVSLWWHRDFYQKRIARPASAVIALCGLLWAVERGF